MSDDIDWDCVSIDEPLSQIDLECTKWPIYPAQEKRFREHYGDKYFDENFFVLSPIPTENDPMTTITVSLEGYSTLAGDEFVFKTEPVDLPAGPPDVNASWADRRAHLMKGKR